MWFWFGYKTRGRLIDSIVNVRAEFVKVSTANPSSLISEFGTTFWDYRDRPISP
jgi:hypothetical protein